ncbi:BTB/POZ domain, partial [Trinorchestia longiramus]
MKDVTGAECEALLAFMYRGEVSVAHDQFERIIRVANSLQVRGLAEMETNSSRPSSPSGTADQMPASASPPPSPSTKCNSPMNEPPHSPLTPASQPPNPHPPP